MFTKQDHLRIHELVRQTTGVPLPEASISSGHGLRVRLENGKAFRNNPSGHSEGGRGGDRLPEGHA